MAWGEIGKDGSVIEYTQQSWPEPAYVSGPLPPDEWKVKIEDGIRLARAREKPQFLQALKALAQSGDKRAAEIVWQATDWAGWCEAHGGIPRERPGPLPHAR